MPRKGRLAKENAAKKEIAAKGIRKITCLFKQNYLMKLCEYFKFSVHYQPYSTFLLLKNPQLLQYYGTAASHAFTFP